MRRVRLLLILVTKNNGLSRAPSDATARTSAAAGSAPAYFFLFMQGIAEEAEAMGFTPEQARLLVQQTALGAAASASRCAYNASPRIGWPILCKCTLN